MHLNYTIIGKRIKLIRTEQKLSQFALAEKIGKSPTYISHIENGAKSASLETLVTIANALKVTTDDLLAECLEYNTKLVNLEYSALLDDCNEYEKRVIMENARELKRILKENRHLVNKHTR